MTDESKQDRHFPKVRRHHLIFAFLVPAFSAAARPARLSYPTARKYDVRAAILDPPAAALIRDLKQPGLLEETLVVWCTEFGRMPMFQKGAEGRDHNPDGFTCWMTGVGVKPGVSHGVTDDLGRKAIADIHPLYDFNATLLHLLGIDHERLTFYHNGIKRRLTNVEGHVIREVLA